MTATSHQDEYQTALKGLAHLDIGRCQSVLGLRLKDGALEIPFYDQIYWISEGCILNRDGTPPTPAVGLVLCRYLLNCPAEPLPHGRRATFRELENAGPLVSSFTANTNKLITSAFARDLRGLDTAGRRMNGTRCDDPPGFDRVIVFSALPHVPVYLHFNAADDLFPAQCSLLFNHSAQGYLDMTSIFILGTYLAGGLMRDRTPDEV
jgi:hypothetical protein